MTAHGDGLWVWGANTPGDSVVLASWASASLKRKEKSPSILLILWPFEKIIAFSGGSGRRVFLLEVTLSFFSQFHFPLGQGEE